MDYILSILKFVGLLLVVLLFFNVTIYVHELGHYLAARWRGLVVDRFQVWFGKPIWKKEKDGVQYSLGWIPAGGFVALPQLAPMESIEGGNREGKAALPPVKPIDKIIVAAAGPIFSFMLAIVFAIIVYFVGKPNDLFPTQTVGYVIEGAPAEAAGIKAGDKVLAINGKKVEGFQGKLNSIMESIMLSEGDELQILVQRPGIAEPLTLTTKFELSESKWWQRRGLRQIGIFPQSDTIVDSVIERSPAAEAGLTKGDKIVALEGKPLFSYAQFSDHLRATNFATVNATIERSSGETKDIQITPRKPKTPADRGPMIGVQWATERPDVAIVHPSPISQFTKSVNTMWVTIKTVVSPTSSIGPQHLAGPVGIISAQVDLLKMENGWRRVLAFMVFLNINLGILNLMPLPVLDGGHIVTSLIEQGMGRPIKAKIMEKVQTAFALLLIGFMLYVTTKDIGDKIRPGSKNAPQEVTF